jgi:AraC family transcriptional regulator of adaptative response/methylated-DNA-[protein]-cysteine methyltransferase
MDTHTLPSRNEMLSAFERRDATYEGVFLTAVRTTGVFCRPTCPARRPRPDNVEFFATSYEALLAGYRPCRRCRPMQPLGTSPRWLDALMQAVEADPTRRWRDPDLRSLGIDPVRARRWFKAHHGMTFHAYSRARRLGRAIGRIREGEAVTATAFDAGYDSLSGFNDALRKLAGASPTDAATRGDIVHVTRISTPLGPMVAAATDDALCLLEFADRRMLPTQLGRLTRYVRGLLAPGDNAVLRSVASQLDDYFAGDRQTFDVPIHVPGTEFQERVWEELRTIPYGETITYGTLARRIGRPAAVRAVGKANGDNPVSILIPCHRVVGSDGKLTGYGGGLWRKQRLLEIETGVPGK